MRSSRVVGLILGAILITVVLLPLRSIGDTCSDAQAPGFRPAEPNGFTCAYDDCGVPIAHLANLVMDSECRGAFVGRALMGSLASLGFVTLALGARRRKEGWPDRAAAWQ